MATGVHEIQTKRCPYCAEEIHPDAIKCKHCGSDLIAQSATAAEPAKPAPVDLGWVLLGIPFAGALLMWAWVSQMTLLQSPESAINLVLVGVVISTAGAAAMEAGKAGMRRDKEKRTYSPIEWGATILLLWIIGYPAYMFGRRRAGLPSRLLASLLAMIVLGVSAGSLIAAVSEKRSELRAAIAQPFAAAQALAAQFESSPTNATPTVDTQAEQRHPEKSDPAPELSDNPTAKIEAYCKQLIGPDGSYELEATCRGQEMAAYRRLATVTNLDPRIKRYCTSLVGDSYELAETCIQQEVRSKAALAQ